MSASGHSRRFGFVRFRVSAQPVDATQALNLSAWVSCILESHWADFVAKLDEEQLARNIRIGATEFLNQHCALALGLESLFRAGPLKIVLQQNRPQADMASIDFTLREALQLRGRIREKAAQRVERAIFQVTVLIGMRGSGSSTGKGAISTQGER